MVLLDKLFKYKEEAAPTSSSNSKGLYLDGDKSNSSLHRLNWSGVQINSATLNALVQLQTSRGWILLNLSSCWRLSILLVGNKVMVVQIFQLCWIVTRMFHLTSCVQLYITRWTNVCYYRLYKSPCW